MDQHCWVYDWRAFHRFPNSYYYSANSVYWTQQRSKSVDNQHLPLKYIQMLQQRLKVKFCRYKWHVGDTLWSDTSIYDRLLKRIEKKPARCNCLWSIQPRTGIAVTITSCETIWFMNNMNAKRNTSIAELMNASETDFSWITFTTQSFSL